MRPTDRIQSICELFMARQLIRENIKSFVLHFQFYANKINIKRKYFIYPLISP